MSSVASSSSSRLVGPVKSHARAILSANRSYASSSSKKSTKPTPSDPLRPTTAAAHEAALAFLSSHQSKCLDRLKDLKAISNPSPAQRRAIEACEISAYVNDPAVRSEFVETGGKGQMHRPIMRHLAERHWKKSGGLDLIMQRVYENKIVPDLVSDMAPTSPLTIQLAEDEPFAPGLLLQSSVLKKPPRVTFDLFNHPSEPSSSSDTPTGLYSLLVVDPDHPEPSTHSFSQRLHYLKTNIPLSIASDQLDLFSEAEGEKVISWEPPAPPHGSFRHRYVFLLLRQPSVVSVSPMPRDDFDFRRYLEERQVSPAAIVGINVAKSEWTEETDAYIERIWQEYRGQAAPRYDKNWGRNVERLIMPATATEIRATEIRQRAWEEVMAAYKEVGLDIEVADAADGALREPKPTRVQENTV